MRYVYDTVHNSVLNYLCIHDTMPVWLPGQDDNQVDMSLLGVLYYALKSPKA